jgi:GrpB-like predicted nucleotidyltransferase (UPF0157 family)
LPWGWRDGKRYFKRGGERRKMPIPIVIVDYNPQWPTMFEEEKARINNAIGDILVVLEHIGSTAVPGLGSKTCIDILAAVPGMPDSLKCIEPLKELGYDYYFYPQYPERCVFIDGTIGGAPHHLHMTAYMNDFWKEKILFRDYLRTHNETADEYYRLKLIWAEKFGVDREEYLDYTNAKDDFFGMVLRKAREEGMQVE